MEIHGPWPAQRVILMLDREDFIKDHLMIQRVLHYFLESGFTVIKHETERMIQWRTLQNSRLAALPKPLRLSVKAAYLLTRPRQWRFFSKQNRSEPISLDYRISCFRAVLQELEGREVILWGRSIGGLVATHIAAAENVRQIIAIGYPFRKPGHPDEPVRYTHLSSLQKPCLILQGINDPYGGSDILAKYQFSPSTRIAFLETDHNFHLSGEKWDEALSTIHTFIDQPWP